MADTLLRTFRFQVKLRESSGEGGGAAAGAAASFGLSAGVSAGASFGAGASVSASAGISASAGFSASAGISASASFSAGSGGGTLADGAFQECFGLEIELDIQEYQEGGRNDGVVRRVGRAKYQNIVLKRGMFYDDGGQVNQDLWKWLQGIASGERPVRRYDGTIEVMGAVDQVVATWTFDRGLPAKVKGPELNAKTGELAIEELHIAHEGLRLTAG